VGGEKDSADDNTSQWHYWLDRFVFVFVDW